MGIMKGRGNLFKNQKNVLTFETLNFETRAPIGLVAFLRPGSSHAFNEKMGEGLIRVFRLMQDDPEVLAATPTKNGMNTSVTPHRRSLP